VECGTATHKQRKRKKEKGKTGTHARVVGLASKNVTEKGNEEEPLVDETDH
jgi:hypothetical protein